MHPRGGVNVAAKPSNSKLTISIIVGMLLIPVSAVAAVMLTEHETQPASDEDTTTTVAETPATVAEIVYANVGATTEDLAYACGEGGLWLVDAETSGAITPVQQAALDALRGICEGQGTPLPGKAAPPPITQTRTVTVTVAPPPPPPAPPAEDLTAAAEEGAPSDDSTSQASTTSTMSPPSGGGDDHSSDDSLSSAPAMGSLDRYTAVHAQAVAEIDRAVSDGGSLEEIGEARAQLAEAERTAASGEYEAATTEAYEAIGKARESVGERDDD